MISKEKHKHHRKHSDLKRPDFGQFGRNELAILGTRCDNIRQLVRQIIIKLSPDYRTAYVDASHSKSDSSTPVDTAISAGAEIDYLDNGVFIRTDYSRKPTSFEMKAMFGGQDLVLVNGNHFTARSQIVVIDPEKSLEKKLDRLTDVLFILLRIGEAGIPGYLRKHLDNIEDIPVLPFENVDAITSFIRNYLNERIPPVKGLVLTGGQSVRMERDKSLLVYHGKTQREYAYDLLMKYCDEVFISCNHDQAREPDGQFSLIEDAFTGLGPMSGILSAFQADPDAAWFTVACDLPYLSDETLGFLLKNRNPSKAATAFYDPKGEFPEPLITIWEPRSYPALLQFLSQGYTCPRKALINSDTQLLHAPDVNELRNVNNPEEYEAAMKELAVRQATR